MLSSRSIYYLTVFLSQFLVSQCFHVSTKSDDRRIPPGDKPFRFCSDSSSTDLFSFDSIELKNARPRKVEH
jgi:hypothetical protein